MIKIKIVNKVSGEGEMYNVEPYTTMRTRMVPYKDEAFAIDTETVIVGSELGTLVCKHKTGEVFYRNESLDLESPMVNMTCDRIIAEVNHE